MDKETEQRIKKVFHGLRNYRVNRRSEEFDIEMGEWFTWITATHDRLEKVTGKGGTRYLDRNDNRKPWSIANIVVRDRPVGIKSGYSRPQKRVIEEDDTVYVTLTKAEWVAEISGHINRREDANSSSSKA
ncbi:hypothetical protein [Shinella oryzae]|uniref:hypothetical protein n=1 Tax=Shinella oryzae TaxID=2871820 RepID=UPI001FF1DA9E|nr:hypothetical protein [Shinella oryzae]UPA25348.1 hypothetical protein K6301_03860 [Shinella oryzae]